MADSGNAQGLGGVNKATPLGSGQASGNDWLGIDSRIADGTTGSRPDSSARYGGDKKGGELFKGPSAARDSKESNSGGSEKTSGGTNQYGGGAFEMGGVGSRENMPKYGGESNKGNLVGAGAGATKDINVADQVKRDLPTQMDTVKGTANGQANVARAQKGIGKAGKSGARM